MTFITNPFALFGGYDPDAQAFITAAEITDTTYTIVQAFNTALSRQV